LTGLGGSVDRPSSRTDDIDVAPGMLVVIFRRVGGNLSQQPPCLNRQEDDGVRGCPTSSCDQTRQGQSRLSVVHWKWTPWAPTKPPRFLPSSN